MPPGQGALGLGKPLLNPVLPAGLVRVALLMLLAGLGEAELGAAKGPGEELLCGSWAASAAELGPWVLNAFTGCLRARGDGAAGDRNLLGEGTPLAAGVGSSCLVLKATRCKFFCFCRVAED